ncbi:MAG: response regulator [archaeon]
MGRILIVDDHREVYETLREGFEETDYASNVDDALRKIEERNYTLVLTDYHLGEDSPKGGLKVLERASKKGIESIMMSTKDHKGEALEAGAMDFVFKIDLLKKYGTR